MLNTLGTGRGTPANEVCATTSGTTAAAVDAALATHGHDRHALLQILRTVQDALGWLPPDALDRCAHALGLTPAIVRGVASFYRFLHLEPVGRVRLLFSDNVTDRHAGSRELAAELCRRLGVRPGAVAADGSASVDFTSCTGLGDQGPALLVNHRQVITRLDGERIAGIAERVRAGVPPADWPAEWQRVAPNVRRAGPLLSAAPLTGQALGAWRLRVQAQGLDAAANALLAELEAAGLRGRGGAGFATATKWRLCRAAPVPEGGGRVVVCNADEGEPGTFKDRTLLMLHADTVVEGMTLAARALGARQGFIYLRGEYRFLADGLRAVLARRRCMGLLGRAIGGEAGFDFDIAVHLGAGAYVCGEESALIESLEGKRGTPRIRPPFPVERGYLGQPTVVNNVETFCAAARIALHGGAWWAGIGMPGSRGSKLHAISGDCARPGVYEHPFGVTVAELLADCGAPPDTQAVQVGGPSGVCLAPHEFGRRIAFDDVPTAGALMVFGAQRDMAEVARGFAHFFAHESCGFCTPCRVGTELVKRRLDKLAAGYGSPFDETELRELEHLLHGTTHCGLGANATNPLRDTLQRFPAAYQPRLAQPGWVPGFDLDAELEPARRATGRDDAHAHLSREG